MKLINFTALNFGSYNEITFDFEEGLTLISGPTGSGKSTFQDIAFWALFGLTAKGGSVDDVRSWSNPNLPTSVELSLLTSQGAIQVTRIRGKQHENDLYWREEWVDYSHRGKDIRETQKLLEARIGLSADDYQISAYFHEFSPSASFFSTSPKNQRALLESVANLEWPVKVAERLQAHKKQVKLEYSTLERTLEKQLGKLEQLNESYVDTSTRLLKWEEDKAITLASIYKKIQSFDETKQKTITHYTSQFVSWESQRDAEFARIETQISTHPVVANDKTCKECGQPNRKVIETELHLKQLKKEQEILSKAQNPHNDKLQAAFNQENHHIDQLAVETNKVNPFINQTETIIKNQNLVIKTIDNDKRELNLKKVTLIHLEMLYDYTFELRGQLLRTSVKNIEKTTNKYLEEFFNAELKIMLDITDTDSVDLLISKSGHDCNFKQLSKGQRGLLTLCFSAAVMVASADRLGVHFDQIFFDEALSGLDSELKVNSFRLFQHLNKRHPSIYIIDHATEFKALFDKQYKVEIVSDSSTIVLDE